MIQTLIEDDNLTYLFAQAVRASLKEIISMGRGHAKLLRPYAVRPSPHIGSNESPVMCLAAGRILAIDVMLQLNNNFLFFHDF